MAASPARSPRLPSPPPMAEDQLGPKSPMPATDEQQKQFSNLDHIAARRTRPGTKAEDMAEGPPLVELSEIDSAFQLTEHLKALHNFLTHPIGSNSIIPVDREVAHKLAQPPDNVDKTLWLYELCRFLTQKANSIIVALFSDSPPCSAQTCPEMRASEWQYLCAVHDPPKSCCAIDYCCHTLDWAANMLTSPKNFPSRLALGTDQSTQHQQIRMMTNIFRRVYRIFAHAWFQHREMFWKVEGNSGVYIMFKTVCDVYGLIPEDNYTIPPEAEGIEDSQAAPTPMILKREPSGPGPEPQGTSVVEGASEHTLSTAGTTKRHRHSPSIGATSVTTVVEESEEEEVGQPSEEVTAAPTSEPASEAPIIPEESSTNENAEPTRETAPVDESKAPQTADEFEEQGESEVKTWDPAQREDENEDEVPAEPATASEPVASNDDKTVAVSEPDAGLAPSAEIMNLEPEKTEIHEAIVDSDKRSDEKEVEEKPMSEE